MATPSRSRPISSSIGFTASDAASACLQEIDGCLWLLLSFPAFPAIALSLASVDRVAGKQVTVGLLQARPSPNKIHLCKERYNRPAQSGRASSNPYLIDSAEFWLRKPNKSPARLFLPGSAQCKCRPCHLCWLPLLPYIHSCSVCPSGVNITPPASNTRRAAERCSHLLRLHLDPEDRVIALRSVLKTKST
jgi:hypothetical protein